MLSMVLSTEFVIYVCIIVRGGVGADVLVCALGCVGRRGGGGEATNLLHCLNSISCLSFYVFKLCALSKSLFD